MSEGLRYYKGARHLVVWVAFDADELPLAVWRRHLESDLVE